MATQYLSCAETSKLVRIALKEAFPGVKFSVRSSTYSMGASISIGWTNGPNTAQVEAVANVFRGSYFDGGIDFHGSVFHLLDGKPVHFGADSFHCSRHFSDSAVQAAIERVYRGHFSNFLESGVDKPTPEQYARDALWNVQLAGMADDLQREIGGVLHKTSDRLKVHKSATAGRVFVTHDDGYSRTNGSGFSAVAHETL